MRYVLFMASFELANEKKERKKQDATNVDSDVTRLVISFYVG